MAPGAVGDPILITDQVMESALLTAFLGGQAGVFSTRGPDKDTPNEDSAALVAATADGGVLAVADGAGGMPNGGHASEVALRQLMLAIVTSAPDPEGGLRAAVLDGIESANQAIMESTAGAATTLAAVALNGRFIRPYHVGDSMILVIGQRGKLKLQTVSHSPVGYAVESGLLNEDEAMVHEDRHLVSNIVGSADMRIEMGSLLEMSPKDTLVIASDGLFDNLTVDEIVERARKGSLEEVMRALAADSLERMRHPQEGQPSKPDDLTFLVYRPA